MRRSRHGPARYSVRSFHSGLDEERTPKILLRLGNIVLSLLPRRTQFELTKSWCTTGPWVGSVVSVRIRLAGRQARASKSAPSLESTEPSCTSGPLSHSSSSVHRRQALLIRHLDTWGIGTTSQAFYLTFAPSPRRRKGGPGGNWR